MRVFLDANVLFSASQPGSAFSRMVHSATRQVTLVTSDLARAEAHRNVSLKRPAWLTGLEALLQDVGVVPSSVFELPVSLGEKDIPILCAAIRAESVLFVTGDRRDFGHLFETLVLGVEIIPPRRLAEWLVERSRGRKS